MSLQLFAKVHCLASASVRGCPTWRLAEAAVGMGLGARPLIEIRRLLAKNI